MLLHSAVAGLGTLGSNSVLKLPKKILAQPQPSEGLTGAARSTSRQSTRVIDKLCQFLSWGPSSWDRDHSPGSSRTPLRWGAFPSEWPERARGRAPDDLVSGAGLTPSFLQDVPEYTDHPSLIWEGVCRSLNTRRTAGMSVLCPSPHPGAGEWMRDVVVRRTHGWTLKFSRSPLGRRRGGGLWSKPSPLPSYSSPVFFSSFVSAINSILLTLGMPILEQNIISVQMTLDSACQTLKLQTQRKVFYIKF